MEDRYQCYIKLEERLLWLFRETEYIFRRLEKPEIYKHPEAFKFLDKLSQNSLHLIIRRPENIRVLKNAYNILILPIIITEKELNRINDRPFMNYKRMLSLVHEIWTNHKENLYTIKSANFKKAHYFKDEIDLLGKITHSL